MNHEQSQELVRWLERASGSIRYGEVGLKVLIHGGEVRRIIRSTAESELPDQVDKDKPSGSMFPLVQNEERQTN